MKPALLTRRESRSFALLSMTTVRMYRFRGNLLALREDVGGRISRACSSRWTRQRRNSTETTPTTVGKKPWLVRVERRVLFREVLEFRREFVHGMDGVRCAHWD